MKKNQINPKRSGRSYSVFIFSTLILLITILMGLNQRLSGQGIQVSPSRIFYNAAPGSSTSQQITITNSGNDPLTLSASFEDWTRDSTGEKKYSSPGQLDHSNAQWLIPSPQQLEIPAGGQTTLNLTISVPENAKPVTNSMLFLTQINEQKPVIKKDQNGRSVGIQIRLRMGVHIYNTLPTVNPNIDLDFLAFDDLGKNSDSTRLLDLKIQNKSAGLADASIRLEMTNTTSGEQTKYSAKMLPMLPGATQHVQFTVSANLTKGKYQALAILDAGNNSDLKIAKKEIVYD